MEPGRLLQCPYDGSHRVRASRFPYHLVKCQRSHEKVARTLATCPYNARHKVPRGQLQSHVATCADNRQPDLFCELGPEPPSDTSAWQGPPCHEDWEADTTEDSSPFVLDVDVSDRLPPGPSSTSDSRTDREAEAPQ